MAAKRKKKKKKKKKKQNEEPLDIILRDIKKKEKVMERYRRLMMVGKEKQALIYIQQHGMLDLVNDDPQFVYIPSDSSESHKKGKSSTSKKASTVAKAASPSQELEIVEITPSPSPSPKKKQPLSFGQQVAAKLLEQQSDKSKKVPAAFKPAVFASLPELKLTASQKHAGEIDELHKMLVLPKGRAVSPTLKPYDPNDGDWV